MAWYHHCIPEHHQDAYNEFSATVNPSLEPVNFSTVGNGVTVLSQAITITQTCVVVAVAELISNSSYVVGDFELEQPKGTIVVDQEDETPTNLLAIFHYASWRLLSPGTYTFELVNRSGANRDVYAAQLKLVAVEG